jgi:hypothetical protein
MRSSSCWPPTRAGPWCPERSANTSCSRPGARSRSCRMRARMRRPARIRAPQVRHQVPGRVDTRCRAADREQRAGRGRHRLSRWCPRPPTSPPRCTTAQRASQFGMRHRQPAGPGSLAEPPGRRPPTGSAPSRFPGRPRPAVLDRHRPEALLDSDGPKRVTLIAAAMAKNHSMPRPCRLYPSCAGKAVTGADAALALGARRQQ